MSKDIIFMGTPNFAVPILNSIYNSNYKILRVYTQSPKKKNRGQKVLESPIHLEAKKLNLDIKYPVRLNKEEDYNFFKNLKSNPVVVVVAYGQIIPEKFLKLSNLTFINIHASLLPKWRGAAPIQRSIMAMDKETGISIMKIVPKLDAGPYMLQEKVKIDENTSSKKLSESLSELASKLIIKSLEILNSGKAEFISQDEKKATYAKKILKFDSKINWELPAKNLVAFINGLNPTPGAWFNYQKDRFKILSAIEINKQGKSGQVLDNNLTIACSKNSIKILLIQKEGKKVLNSEEFLAGNKIKKGDFLD